MWNVIRHRMTKDSLSVHYSFCFDYIFALHCALPTSKTGTSQNTAGDKWHKSMGVTGERRSMSNWFRFIWKVDIK